MKKSIFYLTISIILACMYSCENKQSHKESGINYDIVIIDSCEYIYMNDKPMTASMGITHKGNCKNYY